MIDKLADQLYSMKLGEELELSEEGKVSVWVNRVPGGWIYTSYHYAVFVPFNNEFQR